MSTTNNRASSGAERGNLLVAGLASVAAAVAANLLALLLVRAVVDLPDGFPPLTATAVAAFTLLGTGLGALVYAWLRRRSATPARTYIRVAVVALILSVIPNFLAMANPAMFPFPGGNATAFLVLTLFHVIAAAVSVAVLLRLAGGR